MTSGWVGLLLLAAALMLVLGSGWPTFTVLLGVSAVGGALGAATGAFDPALLGALPGRLVGLLEHDLLQAIALYSLVGALLRELRLADELFRAFEALAARVSRRAAPTWAGLVLATLLAPMNGSVGANLLMTARTAGRSWRDRGLPPERVAALTAVAGTQGVIVPPSLVLLLLGEAMMAAHTQGLNLARQLGTPLAQGGLRIVNTQDVVQAALLPGALLFGLWLAVGGWAARRASTGVAQAPAQGAGAASARAAPRPGLAVAVVFAIAGLLALIATGRVRAVEGAATFGLLVLLWGLATRQLRAPALRRVLDEAMAVSGALFALLVAATTFSLLLRAYGTDGLVLHWMQQLQAMPGLALAAVLLLLLAFTFVLDAFEVIFLVVPIVMPPVLAHVADATWVSALTLLVLQAGFLLPPFGYAVVLARAQRSPPPSPRRLARELAPYLATLLAVVAVLAVAPRLAHPFGQDTLLPTTGAPSDEDVERLLREMSRPRDAGSR